MSNIGLLMKRCQERGSYTSEKAAVSPNFLAQKLLSLATQWGSPGKSIESGTTQYRDTSKVYEVVYLRFFANVTYESRPYVIWCQVILPPAFPIAPPIFSLLNTDSQRFQVNPYFAENRLPDGSYAVIISAASQWKNKLLLEELFQEFMQKIHQYFPFHSSSLVSSPVLPPSYFDPKYNTEASITESTSYSASPEIRAVGGEVDLVQEKLIQEKIQNLKRKVETRGEIMSKLNLDSIINELQNYHQMSKSKTNISADILTLDKVNDFLTLENRDKTGKVLLTSRKNGCQDTAAFIESYFIENETTSYSSTIKSLDRVWKEEFDILLLRKQQELNSS